MNIYQVEVNGRYYFVEAKNSLDVMSVLSSLMRDGRIPEDSKWTVRDLTVTSLDGLAHEYL